MADYFDDLPRPASRDDYQLLKRGDGRELAFMEWGDPKGFPAFYFHGTPSSRLEGAFADSAARTHNFRLIAMDRPGYGRSSFQPDRRFSDWPADVLALADHLGIERFAVVGHSGAGPHLFACGAFISSDRLICIGALGPWGPVASVGIAANLNALDRSFLSLARRIPWLMHVAFAPLGWAAKFWPSAFFGIMRASVSGADRLAMDTPPLLGLFRDMEREAFRQGSKGAAHDALLCYRDWGYDLSDVHVPTAIWLGADDIFVPQTMGRQLERAIPSAQLNLVPGKGHFNIENWSDILAACRTHTGH